MGLVYLIISTIPNKSVKTLYLLCTTSFQEIVITSISLISFIMKNNQTKAIAIIIILAIFNLMAFSQSDSGFKPASSNIQGAEFPKISADNGVYLRFKAPEATKVQVQGGDGLCPKTPGSCKRYSRKLECNYPFCRTRISLLLVYRRRSAGKRSGKQHIPWLRQANRRDRGACCR